MLLRSLTLLFLQTDLQNVINQIGPAITTIQGMIGTWGAIAHDLQSINSAVHDDTPDAIPEIQEITQESILSQWNDLKTTGMS